jgi:hypothetical protein
MSGRVCSIACSEDAGNVFIPDLTVGVFYPPEAGEINATKINQQQIVTVFPKV